MIKLDESYSEFVKPADAYYPWGAAVDATTPDRFDGTPYKARWRNDIIGALHAVFYYAFHGTMRELSNDPDNVKQSDFLDALLKIIDRKATDKSFHAIQVQAEASDIVVPWEALDMEFDDAKKYLVVAVPNDYYENFMPIGTESKRDGVHVHLRQLVNGGITNVDDIIADIIRGKTIRWGSFLWGERYWGEIDPSYIEVKGIKINILVKEI